MSIETKLVKNIIFLAIFCICFDNIPEIFQLSSLSAGLSHMFSWYLLFSLFCIYNRLFKNIIQIKMEKYTIRFCLILIFVLLCSLFAGLYNYPYYDVIAVIPDKFVGKANLILKAFSLIGVVPTTHRLIQWWLSIRILKGIFLGTIYTFGFAYVLYYFIRNHWQDSYDILNKAVRYSLYLMISYSIIELCYLAHCLWAEKFLSVINPFLHTIASSHNWWPPLLWEGQLRSVLSEPSRMGNYAAFCLPILWSNILIPNKNRKITIGITSLFTFMIFMTKARTPVAMYIGLLLLLGCFLWYLKGKQYLKGYGLILLITLLSFSCSIGFINNIMTVKVKNADEAVNAYIESNVESLASSNERSNGARYALIKSNLKVFAEHPILGVGQGLATPYIINHFDNADLSSGEVRMWINDYQEKGPLQYSLDGMNEYVTRLANTGIVGTLLYLFPFFYVLLRWIQKIKKVKGIQQVQILGMGLSLIGSLVVACNGSLTILYASWIMLAYVYASIEEM